MQRHPDAPGRARYSVQMPWVGTPTQARKIEEAAKAARPRPVSKSEILRRACDAYFGLVDGEEVDESTVA